MSSQGAYATLNEYAYDPGTPSRSAYATLNEYVYDPGQPTRSAYATITEYAKKALLVAVSATQASAYADENQKRSLGVATASRQAAAYADENQISPANPYRMLTYDSALGVYIAAPWYVWNGTNWIQAV